MTGVLWRILGGVWGPEMGGEVEGPGCLGLRATRGRDELASR